MASFKSDLQSCVSRLGSLSLMLKMQFPGSIDVIIEPSSLEVANNSIPIRNMYRMKITLHETKCVC